MGDQQMPESIRTGDNALTESKYLWVAKALYRHVTEQDRQAQHGRCYYSGLLTE